MGPRRVYAGVTGAVLILEACGFVVVNLIIGDLLSKQEMELGGIGTGLIANSTRGLGAVAGLFLALCALVALLVAVRDTPPGRFGRILLIGCAVLHGVLGALAVGLLGWTAFVGAMVVLGLLVLTLMAYPVPEQRTGQETPAPPVSPAPSAQ